LLNCIKAAVGACVIAVVRAPRRRFRAGACGKHQCQRSKRGTGEDEHIDLRPATSEVNHPHFKPLPMSRRGRVVANGGIEDTTGTVLPFGEERHGDDSPSNLGHL